MAKYALLPSAVPNISKRGKSVLIFVIFSSILWFYFAYRQPDELSAKSNEVKIDSSNNVLKNKTSDFILKSLESSLKAKNGFANDSTTENFTTFMEKSKDFKYILFWKKFFGNSNWYAGKTGEANEETLKSFQCPVTNCIFTHNRNLLGDETKFDAIAFHIAGEYLSTNELPKMRGADQLYIFASLE